MKPFVLLALATPVLAAPLPVYLGTQTGKSGKSEGIYSTTFDPETGKLGEVKLAAKYQQPGFLLLHPSKPLLYCVGSPATPYADGSSSVAAFKIIPDGTLEFLKDCSVGGKGACHLALDATGHTLATANYGNGSISTVRLVNDLPDSTATVLTLTGSGPNPARQQAPHAHGVYFNPDNNRLLVPDLGLDKVWSYAFDASKSTFDQESASTGSFTAEPGSGPRHVAFSPDNKNAYVVNELDNTVSACAFDAKAGTLKSLQRISTLPEGWSGQTTTAEIEVHPNGRFVYASNRGHDSIAIFARDHKTGALTSLGQAPCGGKIPRHFAIAPGGKWLVCAHQDSNTLAVLPLDPQTGKLGEAGSVITAPNVICIAFGKKND
jgi:6-phosphogluconolactonase